MAAFIPLSPLRCRNFTVSDGMSFSRTSPSRPRSPRANPISTPTMIRGFPNNLRGDNGGDSRKSSESADAAARSWDHLVDFPTVFTFKVIGMAQGDFLNDIVDSVALALQMDRKYLKTSFRDRGKYRSITLEAPVNTSDQIYDVYAAIDRDPRVKFKF